MKEEKSTEKKKKNNELEELTKINLELEQKVLRIQAEFQNYMRRSNEEVSKLLKYSNEEIVISLLPIIDNFERALDMKTSDEEVKKYLEGFALVHQNLVDTLKSFEVTEMNCLGKSFDPNYHNAVMTDSDDSKNKDIILEVLQKGYMLKDKVIRPAMVKVNK